MNRNQAAAFINAQTALFGARIVAMQAENTSRLLRQESLAYTEEAFSKVIEEAEPVIGYNAVYQLYQHATEK